MARQIQLHSLRINDLRRVRSGNAFVGGCHSEDLEDLQAHIDARTDFGTGEREKFRYCYYARSANVKDSVNKLLNRAKLNTNGDSACEAKVGYAYVCTYGKRHE